MTDKEVSNKFIEIVDELFRLAKKAINKQVPIAPDVYGDGCSDGEIVYDMWKCPRCGTSFEIEYEKHDYCPNCGQAIDWTVYEEDEIREN